MANNIRNITDSIDLITERLETLSELLVYAISEIPCTEENVSKSLGICYLVYDELVINTNRLKDIKQL